MQALSPTLNGATKGSGVGWGYSAVIICAYSDTVTGTQGNVVATFLHWGDILQGEPNGV